MSLLNLGPSRVVKTSRLSTLLFADLAAWKWRNKMWSSLALYASRWGLSVFALAQFLFSHPWLSFETIADMLGREVKPFWFVVLDGVLWLTDGRVIL